MIHQNLVLQRESQKPIVWDTYYKADSIKKPLVIFCHGYKGFKDWGAWHLVAETFSEAGFFFVKFNFSHNGGTVKNPIDFPDLQAFAENNYSKELEDLDAMIDHLVSEDCPFKAEIDPHEVVLIGHSRGGGIAIIKASEDPRITKLITWASVSDFKSRMGDSEELASWKESGVKYVLNGRTKQKMPHNYQFYEDFVANEDRLNISAATKKINIPHLIIHALEDHSVPFKEAEALHGWNPNSDLFPIEKSDHVFGASHPWKHSSLPYELGLVVKNSISFITDSNN